MKVYHILIEGNRNWCYKRSDLNRVVPATDLAGYPAGYPAKNKFSFTFPFPFYFLSFNFLYFLDKKNIVIAYKYTILCKLFQTPKKAGLSGTILDLILRHKLNIGCKESNATMKFAHKLKL